MLSSQLQPASAEMSSSGDDEAPEQISWKSSKHATLQAISAQKSAIKTAKQRLKLHRQTKDAKLKEQRRQKAKPLQPLSEDLMEQALLAAAIKKKKDSSKTDENTRIVFARTEEPELPEDLHEHNIVLLKNGTREHDESLARLQAEVASFRQRHLFGDRLRRIPSSESHRRFLSRRK